MTEVCIDPATARQAGVDISPTATTPAPGSNNNEPAKQANEGWQSGPALADFAAARKQDILSSLAELESIGKKIVEVVTARTSVDERYATSLDRIGKAVDSMSQ
ncbi:hypothetical protein [Nocardia australiensis]|uniref:hypothetical protein n=1 Tax=Nocardia australiensis TaxID=2887191 RepID=UPI001D13BC34|nr:hypothetical protein [Nocardia australiensis]